MSSNSRHQGINHLINMKREINEISKMIGHKIKLRRKSLGLTQDQLARCLGLTFQQIQKYESGVNNVSICNLYKLSKILKVNVNYFINNNIINKDNTDIETKELAKVVEYYNKIKNREMKNIALQLIKKLASLGGKNNTNIT